ncbi:MAG: hypothetical protein HQL32_07865, partial [Planctomycetes bacterium]|nr:hypothetical protein [Planctomycetota bacterium]
MSHQSTQTPNHAHNSESSPNKIAHDGHSQSSTHPHEHNPAHCCPVHEPLSEGQVKSRLNLAILSSILLMSGALSSYLGNSFSGTLQQLFACILMAGPILRDSWTGLKVGRIGFPSLVALAFLACLAEQSYDVAGLVGFF